MIYVLVENTGETGRELKSDKGYDEKGAMYIQIIIMVITVKDRHATI